VGSAKNFFKYFSKKLKFFLAILNRSIRKREVLVHSILISEVKDMESDVLRAL
jgi:hypothetical protein